MFTLKLFKRVEGRLITKTIAVHHVETLECHDKDTPDLKTLEIRAYDSNNGGDYVNYYVGDRTDAMTALTDANAYGWGLLENWEGNTSEHYRPASYG